MSRPMDDNVESTCVFCGVKFLATKKSAQYCSGSCKEKARQQRLGKLRGEINCPNCGSVFQPKTGKQKFCSRSCSSAYAHKNKWKEHKHICIDCGAEFLAQRKDRLRCVSCWKKHRSMQTMLYRYQKDPTVQIGAGSGGAQHPIVDVYDKETREKLNAGRRARYRARKKSREASYKYRSILTGNDSCECCGYNKSQDAIIVHHLDMDRTHNELSNLCILCCNCHAIMHALIRRAMKQDGVTDPVKIYESFKAATKAEVKQRKKSGTSSSSQSDLKAVRNRSQGQSIPAGEDIPSADTRPLQLQFEL